MTTNNYTNDYTLLRDFDLEAAKMGSPICTPIGTDLIYIAHEGATVFVKLLGEAIIIYSGLIKMRPLFWLEGKPVYVGDTVYHVVAGKGTITEKKTPLGEYRVAFEQKSMGTSGCIISNLSLIPFPPVKQERKGWINIWKCSSAVGASTGSQVYATKEDALAGLFRFGLVDTVEITWME